MLFLIYKYFKYNFIFSCGKKQIFFYKIIIINNIMYLLRDETNNNYFDFQLNLVEENTQEGEDTVLEELNLLITE